MEQSQSTGIRINKYLADAGVCSRRKADRLIEEGRVLVNGKPAETGMRVRPGDVVLADGKTISPEEEAVLIACHKPRGIVCTSDSKEKDNIIDFIGYPKRIYTIGRLDKDSEGLILLTNQGDLVNRIMRAGNYHEKEYVVTLDRPWTQKLLDTLAKGVWLEELAVYTRPCKVLPAGAAEERRIRIILTQGLNRQIRRMCEACGYQVERLVRERVMNIKLDGIPEGKWRDVTAAEREELAAMLVHSYSAPAGSEQAAREQGGKI